MSCLKSLGAVGDVLRRMNMGINLMYMFYLCSVTHVCRYYFLLVWGIFGENSVQSLMGRLSHDSFSNIKGPFYNRKELYHTISLTLNIRSSNS